jgi:hypothetical protein
LKSLGISEIDLRINGSKRTSKKRPTDKVIELIAWLTTVFLSQML